MVESFYENDELQYDQNESFDVEPGFDEEQLVLCNKRIDYQLRPTQLNDICLYTFYSEYRKAKITKSDKLFFDTNTVPTLLTRRERPPNDRWLFQLNHPQYSSHIIIRRSFHVVPVLIGPSIPRRERDDTSERYARCILTLFHPWRTVMDIHDLNKTWLDALESRQNGTISIRRHSIRRSQFVAFNSSTINSSHVQLVAINSSHMYESKRDKNRENR